MANVVLDTGPLADFLGQYFGPALRGSAPFRPGVSLSDAAARVINVVTASYYRDEPARYLVFASSLAFVEVARKWDALASGRFAPHQLRAFLETPPDWFAVDPVDESLIGPFLSVPVTVAMANGEIKNIEWADAIHVATAFGHDTGQTRCLLAVEDRRIQRIPQLAGRWV